MTNAVSNTESPSHEVQALLSTDLCDGCGAQAYVRVTMTAGELLFCGHHAAQAKDAMGDKILSWHDETDRLRNDESK